MATPMIPPAAAPAFLAAHGWAGAEILPLAGDASFRRYFRVVEGQRTAVLMDAPPDKEDSRPFLGIAGHLRDQGFAAPRALAVDLALGLILLEDFGDARVTRVLADAPTRAGEIYGKAIDVLAALHRLAPPEDVAPYDRAVLERELLLFPEWYMPAMGLKAESESFLAAWREVLTPVLEETAANPILVLRDFHADNLMLLDKGTGVQSLGLLDFQDALAGHPAYDLVSLLQDARRDVSMGLERQMLDAYWQAMGIENGTAFRRAYDVLGAQRNIKILGIFTRLWKRDNKPHYRAFQPRVWGLLARNFTHPALAPVRAWFDAHVPPEKRAAAWEAYL